MSRVVRSGLIFLLAASGFELVAEHAAAGDDAPAGVAVVELFTSEGCSSCPPADTLLCELDTIAHQNELPIICIGWHVDYWNRLGWDDRFSSEDVSDRQRAYARAYKSERIYTPQMIVNGVTEFNGSSRPQAVAAITAAFKEPPRLKVELSSKIAADSTLKVKYRVDGVAPDLRLTLVVVDKQATTDVGRGENSGRTLTHVNAARTFRVVKLSNRSTGEVDLTLPDDLKPAEALLVGFAQDAKSMQVLGATQVSLKL